MRLDRKAMVALGLLLSLTNTVLQARVSAICMVSYQTENGGWSPDRRVEVEFYSSRELFPDDREYPVYTKIWFNPENPAIVALDGTSLVSPVFMESSLQRLFSNKETVFGAERDDPQRWRVRAVTGKGQWVDPKYPAAFEPPSQAPQVPEVQQGTHTYIINGRTVTCRTVGRVTSCY